MKANEYSDLALRSANLHTRISTRGIKTFSVSCVNITMCLSPVTKASEPSDPNTIQQACNDNEITFSFAELQQSPQNRFLPEKFMVVSAAKRIPIVQETPSLILPSASWIQCSSFNPIRRTWISISHSNLRLAFHIISAPRFFVLSTCRSTLTDWVTMYLHSAASFTKSNSPYCKDNGTTTSLRDALYKPNCSACNDYSGRCQVSLSCLLQLN
jgi:hypothetical protein